MSETEGRRGEEDPADPGRPSAPDEREPNDAPREDAEGDVELDEVDVRDLLRSALEPPAPKPRQDAVLLKGVQRRLRQRSRGKFYADGWSTSRSPRSTYLVTSIFMLLLIAFVFLVLVPWSNGALP